MTKCDAIRAQNPLCDALVMVICARHRKSVAQKRALHNEGERAEVENPNGPRVETITLFFSKVGGNLQPQFARRGS